MRISKKDQILLAEAYNLINELSSDYIRRAVDETKGSGYEYDNKRRDSLYSKALMKDLRDPNLPIICIEDLGPPKEVRVCKFKLVSLVHVDDRSIVLEAILIRAEDREYRKEVIINYKDGHVRSVGGSTTEFVGKIFFPTRLDVNKWLQYIKGVLVSYLDIEPAKLRLRRNDIETANNAISSVKSAQFDIRMPEEQQAIEQLEFLRRNGVESPQKRISKLLSLNEPRLGPRASETF